MFSMYNRKSTCDFVNLCNNILDGIIITFDMLRTMEKLIHEKLINYHQTYKQIEDLHKVSNLVYTLDLLLIKIEKKKKLILEAEVNFINNNQSRPLPTNQELEDSLPPYQERENSLPNYIRPNSPH